MKLIKKATFINVIFTLVLLKLGMYPIIITIILLNFFSLHP